MKKKQKMKGINQKGFGHHLLIIIVAVLAVGAVGFAGWRIYSAKKLDAQAASWSTIGSWRSDVTLRACKTYTDSKFGPLWKVQLLDNTPNSATEKPTFVFRVHRSGNAISTTKLGPGIGYYKTTYASVLLGDTYSVSVSYGSAGAEGTASSFANIKNC